MVSVIEVKLRSRVAGTDSTVICDPGLQDVPRAAQYIHLYVIRSCYGVVALQKVPSGVVHESLFLSDILFNGWNHPCSSAVLRTMPDQLLQVDPWQAAAIAICTWVVISTTPLYGYLLPMLYIYYIFITIRQNINNNDGTTRYPLDVFATQHAN
ncbi:hypothetical protein BC835DRAFT_5776 [Cytidiella melzeri]|nr:hypothetical protein BC835DRAFT_5776 [Cytidiella melzeri]